MEGLAVCFDLHIFHHTVPINMSLVVSAATELHTILDLVIGLSILNTAETDSRHGKFFSLRTIHTV